MSSYAYQHIDKVDYDKYKGKGLTGLANLGNTCFMNSCLQCLSHTYPLRDLITNDKFIKTKLELLNQGTLIKEWAGLNNLMWKENCVISCDRWIECVQKVAIKQNQALFTGFEQNDCAEFLVFVLDNFHESLKREVKMTINGTVENEKDKIAVKCYGKIKEMYEKEYSELINIFFGVQITRIRSASDRTQVYTEKPEPFFLVNLSIPESKNTDKNNFTLDECFNHGLEKELLEGDNAWFNETTGEKENVYIEHSYWNLPNILILCLKRFDNYGKKINKALMVDNDTNEENDYCIKVNLSNYVEGCNEDTYNYEVYGFCVHSGGTRGGHYISVIKTANNEWYLFNDQLIKKIKNPKTQVANLYGRSYCLFLKKI